LALLRRSGSREGTAMRQMALRHVWADGHWVERTEPEASEAQEKGRGRMLWKYGWGLLFVVAMTLLSVFGPRTRYSKLPPAPPAARQPAVHSIK
jgi:hypothetical protein